MPQKDTQSSSCEWAPPCSSWADSHFLDIHVSHCPLEKCYWHCQALKECDCCLHTYSQEHKEKQKSSEYSELQHNHKFYFRRGNSDKFTPLQYQLLPTEIPFQLQKEALAKPKRDGRRRAGECCYPKVTAACRNYSFPGLKRWVLLTDIQAK